MGRMPFLRCFWAAQNRARGALFHAVVATHRVSDSAVKRMGPAVNLCVRLADTPTGAADRACRNWPIVKCFNEATFGVKSHCEFPGPKARKAAKGVDHGIVDSAWRDAVESAEGVPGDLRCRAE